MSDQKKRLQAITRMATEGVRAKQEEYLPAIIARANSKMEDAAEEGFNYIILSVLLAGDVPKDMRDGVRALVIEYYGSDGFDCRPLPNEFAVKVSW